MTPADHVAALLDLAGINPSEEEVDALVAGFPDTRARVERLWALELGDIAPAPVFRAGEPTGPWEVTHA